MVTEDVKEVAVSEEWLQEKDVLKTEEWKWMKLPWYFTPFKIVSSDNQERTVGKEEGGQ